MTRWRDLRLQHGRVTLRPIRRSDRAAWHEVRRRNGSWLSRWEATRPPGSPPSPPFNVMVRHMRRDAAKGRVLPLVLLVDGELAGQVTVSNIIGGSARFANLGYWIDYRHAGQGFMPVAVALTADHCWFGLGLHRVEVAIRPENTASLRVVEKLGFVEYGYAPRYLHIDGGWRDHRLFALTSEEIGDGLLARLSGK